MLTRTPETCCFSFIFYPKKYFFFLLLRMVWHLLKAFVLAIWTHTHTRTHARTHTHTHTHTRTHSWTASSLFLSKRLHISASRLHYNKLLHAVADPRVSLAFWDSWQNCHLLNRVIVASFQKCIICKQSRYSLYAEYASCVGPPKHQGPPCSQRCFNFSFILN